jgi:hypothetical protein
MPSPLLEQVERIKKRIEEQFSVKLAVKPDSMNSYPDLFELWTLFNVIKAITRDEEGELFSANSYMERNTINIVSGDVHPSGEIHKANIELIGMGIAPTAMFSSQRSSTSIWYDKYVGVCGDGHYWPRPDITLRPGAYDVVKSVRYETSAEKNSYQGSFEVIRGRRDSEAVKGWRSLSELIQGNPILRRHSAELVQNFKITKDVFSVVSTDTQETVAAAGRPPDALPSEDRGYVRGEIVSDDGVVSWARKKAFTQPKVVVECKSGLLTPHAIDQLIAYKKLFSTSLLIVTTTRLLQQEVQTKLRTHNIQVIAPPTSLGQKYADALAKEFEEALSSP